MIPLATSLMALFTTVAADVAPLVVQAPDTPVRLDHAKVLNVGAAEPAYFCTRRRISLTSSWSSSR